MARCPRTPTGGRGPRHLSSRPTDVCVPLSAACRQPVGRVPEQGLSECAHRLRAQPQPPVLAASQGPRRHQCRLQVLQRPDLGSGLIPEQPLQDVQVDIAQRRVRVGLRQLVDEAVEVGDVLEHTRPVAEHGPYPRGEHPAQIGFLITDRGRRKVVAPASARTTVLTTPPIPYDVSRAHKTTEYLTTHRHGVSRHAATALRRG